MTKDRYVHKDLLEWHRGAGLTNDQIDALFCSIDVNEPSPELVNRIKNAAMQYLNSSAIAHANWPSARQQRNAVKEISKITEKFSEVVKKLYVPTTEEGDKLSRLLLKIDLDNLRDIKIACSEILPTIPNRGPLPKVDRILFVQDLLFIFWDATGIKPTRNKDPANDPTGKLHNFVVATIEAMESPETMGIDDIIKKVVKKMG